MRSSLCCASLVALMLGCAAPAQNSQTRTVDKLTAEEEAKMDCHYETPTGSHLEYKVCRTKEETQALRRERFHILMASTVL